MVEDGHYAQKQLRCQSRVIAWGHSARFRMALALAGTGTGCLLDYGCGDGTFLGMVASRWSHCVGVDVDAEQQEDCRVRFTDVPNVRLLMTRELGAPEHRSAYGLVICMETLEHCPASAVEIVLDDIERCVRQDGRVIISVPVETGPAFILKYVARGLAAWRGLSDYRHYERYTVGNALRMIFATGATTFDRPVYGTPDFPSHSHYGFNWRLLRTRIATQFIIDRVLFSPINLPGGWVASQAWLVCRPRRPSHDGAMGSR
jgi:SAM-dependent methyltransferase